MALESPDKLVQKWLCLQNLSRVMGYNAQPIAVLRQSTVIIKKQLKGTKDFFLSILFVGCDV